MTTLVEDKRGDLAGPGIGDYGELENTLPKDYHSQLSPKETQRAIFQVKRHIEDNLCKQLNLMMVEVPLRKAHLGEVSVSVWPKILKEMCARKNIFVLE